MQQIGFGYGMSRMEPSVDAQDRDIMTELPLNVSSRNKQNLTKSEWDGLLDAENGFLCSHAKRTIILRVELNRNHRVTFRAIGGDFSRRKPARPRANRVRAKSCASDKSAASLG